jgi:hypothetical protein
MIAATCVGPNGALVVPESICNALQIKEGSLLFLEFDGDRLIVRSGASSTEYYFDHRRAEFLLNNAVNASDYLLAREHVKRLGLDPDEIPHEKPA